MNQITPQRGFSAPIKDFLIWLHWTLVILGIVWVGQAGLEAFRLNFVSGYAEHKRLAEANTIIEEQFEVATASPNVNNKTIRK